MSNMMQEFKEFALKGDMMDMAIGIIIGGAFGKVVSSLVNDIIMPPLGVLLGGVNFTDLGIVLKAAHGETAAVVWRYGAFIQTLVDFLIVALAVFFVVKGINAMRRKEEAPPAPEAPPEPSAEEQLLAEIRDLLKAR